MSLLRDLGATTPFISASPERFKNRAIQNGVVGQIPGVGSLVRSVPFAGFFDDRLKYPLLVAGRLAVSITVTILLTQFTLTPSWQSFVDTQILPKVAPAPVKNSFTESGNFFEDNGKRVQVETEFLINQGVHNLYKGSWDEALTGTITLPIRFAVVYAVIHLLYLAFGNTISQLERKYLRKTGQTTELGNTMILMLNEISQTGRMQPLEVQELQRIVSQLTGGITEEDRIFVVQLARKYFILQTFNKNQRQNQYPQNPQTGMRN